ncbi:MAG: glycosyltransferase [Planctomycetes bacterium]|nr:glycosyltransferase [Planctomycetota bacterium]
MRIAFDVSPLARPHPRGVARAARGAVEALERRGVLDIVRLAPNDGEDLRAWRHGELARRAEAAGCEGLHSFVSALPLAARLPRVQTVHELPWRHGVAENADLGHRAWVHVGGLVARAVATPSEFVARELRAELVAGASKVNVVPWGVGAPFGVERDEARERELVRSFELDDAPLVLAPGATRSKKNLGAAIRGLAALGVRARLVVTGERTESLASDLELARSLGVDVVATGELDDCDLVSLHHRAHCVVVLSRSEGFAFPVLEALACGLAVVVARDDAAAELAGADGIVADADRPDEVARALAAALASERRHEPRGRALELTWDRCAERIETLWRGLGSR